MPGTAPGRWWAWLLWAAAAGATGGPAAAAPPPTAAPGVPVFARGEGGYFCVKIPSLVAWEGEAGGQEVLLAFGEGRRGSCADSAPTDLVLKRSQDGGRTWGALAVVAGDGANTFGNAAPVVSRREGEPDVLVLPFCRNNREVLVTRSGDGGLTFDEPVLQPHLVGAGWRWVGLGPPAGLRLKNGRLLIPAYHGSTRLDGTFTQGHTVFSDDGGASWELGEPYGGLHQVNENQVVEFGDGELLSNARGILPWRLQVSLLHRS